MTAGLLATSLAAAILALSSTNLAAIGGLTSGATAVAIADPSRNLLGTVGHMQVFVFSDWLSSSLPIEYSETTKGLRWLIPHEKLPWKKEEMSMWPHYPSNEFPSKISIEFGGSNSSCIASLLQQKMRRPTEVAISLPKNYGNQRRPNEILAASFHGRIKSIPYGLPLDSSEYFIYFLRGEPLSIDRVVNKMENYTGWDDFGMNMFWLGVAAVSILSMHLLILIFLRWRTGKPVHGLLSFPRFELFLLILMLPCMSQSSAFVIRGGTTGGIIAGSLLLAVPAALLLSVSLFLVVAVFMGSFVQYKEVKKESSNDPWHSKLLNFFTGRPTTGKWFHLDHLPTSFLSRFGILFQDRKGPPIYLLVDRNDPVGLPEWIESSQSGIKRMQAVSLSDSNEDTKIHTSDRILGCARAAYLILDLLRRVGLAIISGSCSLNENAQKKIQCLLLLALGVTLVQFLYLFFLQPYIRRGVHVAESVSLLCELGIFGLSFYMENRYKFNNQRHIGSVMIALLFISFVCHLVNEWYALIEGLLRLPQPQEPSFKRGLKWAAKGLILPFLPRKHWSRLVPGWAQPKTGLIPVVPASPGIELERQDNRGPRVDPLSSMTATVVPIYSPDMPGLTDPILPSTSQQHETEMTQSGQALNQRSQTKIGEGKRQKGLQSDVKNEIKMLQEMAKASFLAGRKIEEGSTSYNTPREQHQLDQPSPDDSKT